MYCWIRRGRRPIDYISRVLRRPTHTLTAHPVPHHFCRTEDFAEKSPHYHRKEFFGRTRRMSWREQWQTPQTLHEDKCREALKTLGLDDQEHTPSLAEVKERYRELAHRYHPDQHLGQAEKAAAEAEFKRVGQAFARLQRELPLFGSEFVAIDPFGSLPWYHRHRFPPWSFSRGPPYAPGWFVSTIVFGGIAAVYSALLYDAANPAFGERRVASLLEREAEIKRQRLAESADIRAKSHEESEAFRVHVRASLEAVKAQNDATAVEDPARSWWPSASSWWGRR